MDVIVKVFNRIVDCLEGICNDIECQLDSGCCHTHKKMHDKESQTIDLKENENKIENDLNK
jgi:hypothetical protein